MALPGAGEGPGGAGRGTKFQLSDTDTLGPGVQPGERG